MMKNILIIISLFFLAQNIFAQCNENRHSTNWYDGWISCEQSTNPNTANENSHWLMYNFKQIYHLNQIHIWNLNDPNNLNAGVKEVILDYSLDGNNWINWGTFTVEKANGIGIYSGVEGPDLQGLAAQYVLITAKSTWGGQTCAGFGEIRFEVDEPVKVEEVVPHHEDGLIVNAGPNPFSYHTDIQVKSNSNEPIYYELTDVLGKVIVVRTMAIQSNFRLSLTQFDLSSGVYILTIFQGSKQSNIKLLRK